MPAPEDDAGILDLGVPAWRRFGEGGIELMGACLTADAYAPEHLHLAGWTHVHVTTTVSAVATVSVIHYWAGGIGKGKCCWEEGK